MEINKDTPLIDVLTEEMIERALKRGAKGAIEDVQEFTNHVHTLWDRIADLYNEYAIPLTYLGIRVELKMTDRFNNTVVESKLGIKKVEDDDANKD